MTVAATAAAISLPSRDFPWRINVSRSPRTNVAAAPGAAAVVLWALWPALAVAALAVPPFLLLAIAFAGGFLVLAADRRLAGRPVADLFAAPSGVTAVGLSGVIGSHALWLLALRLAVPADASVVAAPWPVLGAAFGGLIGQSPVADASLAYLLALGGALCWIASGKARRRRAGGVANPMGALCGIAAPLCFLLHLCLEPRLPLDGTSLLAAAALGLGPIGIACTLWDRAARAGDGGTLSAARRRGAAGR